MATFQRKRQFSDEVVSVVVKRRRRRRIKLKRREERVENGPDGYSVWSLSFSNLSHHFVKLQLFSVDMVDANYDHPRLHFRK
jgi:hypothetical protein